MNTLLVDCAYFKECASKSPTNCRRCKNNKIRNNVPAFMKLTGIDLAHGKSVTAATLIGRTPYQVQRRRHKKKRINKKWAKRYGYVTKFREYRLENVEIHQDGGILDIAAKRGYFLV